MSLRSSLRESCGGKTENRQADGCWLGDGRGDEGNVAARTRIIETNDLTEVVYAEEGRMPRIL